jgi:hypothetical protein
MLRVARSRRALLVALVAGVVLPSVGCGGGNDSQTVQVDEVKQKALTDSMRGYYEKNEKKKR